MAETTYAVHTRSCIYLLDDDGVCSWALASAGAPHVGAERCIGAQFVACLDLAVEGGLVGDLRLGASALFAREEDGRLVLLRTQPIEHVEIRPRAHIESEPTAPLPLSMLGHPSAPDLDLDAPTPTSLLGVIPAPDPEPEVFLDPEDLVSVTVTEVTLTLPLYRPPVPMPEPAPLPRIDWPTLPRAPAKPPARKGIVGPGRRLR